MLAGMVNEEDSTSNLSIVHFPEDRLIGTIVVEGSDASHKYVRKNFDARDKVKLPTNMKLRFRSKIGKPLDMSVLISSIESLNWEKLYLRRVEINDQDLVHVAKLKSVKRLYLGDNPITDIGLKHLSTMPNLWALDLGGTKITNEGLKHLEPLASLNMLKLSGTQVTDAGVAKLTGLPQLERLNLAGCSITDDSLKYLA